MKITQMKIAKMNKNKLILLISIILLLVKMTVFVILIFIISLLSSLMVGCYFCCSIQRIIHNIKPTTVSNNVIPVIIGERVNNIPINAIIITIDQQ
jgi:hypothetical protein